MFSDSLSAFVLCPLLLGLFLCSPCCWAGRPGQRVAASHNCLQSSAHPTIALQQKAVGMSVFPNICYYPVLPIFAAFSWCQVVWPTLPVFCINITCQWSYCFIVVVLGSSYVKSLNVFPWLACLFYFSFMSYSVHEHLLSDICRIIHHFNI